MSSDVVILRRESVVSFIRGQASSPIVEQVSAPPIVIQREGIRGPAGANGDSATYQHVQSSSSDQWVVNHNFGAYPTAVAVFLASGQEVEADVQHTSVNQLLVNFVLPQTGFVRVSP